MILFCAVKTQKRNTTKKHHNAHCHVWPRGSLCGLGGLTTNTTNKQHQLLLHQQQQARQHNSTTAPKKEALQSCWWFRVKTYNWTVKHTSRKSSKQIFAQ